MANPHKGEVEIKLNKAVSKGYLKPHGAIRLKFNMNAMSDAEREFKGDKTIAYILNKSQEDPTSTSFDDMRILLSLGLRHQFPTINREIAGNIMDVEDFAYVTSKIGEALSLAMTGNIISDDSKKRSEFVRYAEEVEIQSAEEETEEVGEDAKN